MRPRAQGKLHIPRPASCMRHAQEVRAPSNEGGQARLHQRATPAVPLCHGARGDRPQHEGARMMAGQGVRVAGAGFDGPSSNLFSAPSASSRPPARCSATSRRLRRRPRTRHSRRSRALFAGSSAALSECMEKRGDSQSPDQERGMGSREHAGHWSGVEYDVRSNAFL